MLRGARPYARERARMGPLGFANGRGRGLSREGARRKGIVHHVRRPGVKRGCPAHATLRVREDVPSLRRRTFVREFQRSLGEACERRLPVAVSSLAVDLRVGKPGRSVAVIHPAEFRRMGNQHPAGFSLRRAEMHVGVADANIIVK